MPKVGKEAPPCSLSGKEIDGFSGLRFSLLQTHGWAVQAS